MNVAILKHNAGNIYSVVNAVRRIGIEPIVTSDPVMLQQATHVIIPGQGEAGNTMQYLKNNGLDTVIRSLTMPVLGICIGMQLMCRFSEENSTDCLGIFDVDVKKFIPSSHTFKIPQMGWNEITDLKSPLYKGVQEKSFVYFIHSFYVPLCDETISTTDYILPYSSGLHKDNFYATQFHPEKSGDVGELILKNFLSI